MKRFKISLRTVKNYEIYFLGSRISIFVHIAPLRGDKIYITKNLIKVKGGNNNLLLGYRKKKFMIKI